MGHARTSKRHRKEYSVDRSETRQSQWSPAKAGPRAWYEARLPGRVLSREKQDLQRGQWRLHLFSGGSVLECPVHRPAVAMLRRECAWRRQRSHRETRRCQRQTRPVAARAQSEFLDRASYHCEHRPHWLAMLAAIGEPCRWPWSLQHNPSLSNQRYTVAMQTRSGMSRI